MEGQEIVRDWLVGCREDLKADLGLEPSARWWAFWEIGPTAVPRTTRVFIEVFPRRFKERIQKVLLHFLFGSFILKALEDFEGRIEDELLEQGLVEASHTRKLSRKLFTIREVVEMLARGSPIGSKESDTLALLERAFRDGPLGQRPEDGLLRTESWEPSPEKILTLLESGLPVGCEESDFLDAVRKAGYRR